MIYLQKMVILHSCVSLPEGNYHYEYHYHYHYHCQKLLLAVMIHVDELLSSQHTLSKCIYKDLGATLSQHVTIYSIHGSYGYIYIYFIPTYSIQIRWTRQSFVFLPRQSLAPLDDTRDIPRSGITKRADCPRPSWLGDMMGIWLMIIEIILYIILVYPGDNI